MAVRNWRIVGINRGLKLASLKMKNLGVESKRVIDLHVGSLEARLAETAQDVDAVQALRYRVFYEELSARPSAETSRLRRDVDAFDDVCDHIMVIDHAVGVEAVVGTYRVLRREPAMRHGEFYSADEYNISCILAQRGEILELGRSCVDMRHRNRPTMQLMWQAITTYVIYYNIVIMFGCGSLPGTCLEESALPLSYLYYHHLAPPNLRPRALPERYTEMAQLPAEAIDRRAALAQIPPLIKGYLRLGGFVGDGAVIDRQFNTTDVLIVVKTDLVTDKYYKHFERVAREGAAS